MVFLGSDHGGYRRKEVLRSWLVAQGFAVADLGPPRLRPTDDYPAVAVRVAEAVRRRRGSVGILLCRTGAGVALVANKVPGIRAVLAPDVRSARAARSDEDANVLALAGQGGSVPRTRAIVAAFLRTPFSLAARHRRRVREVARIDARYRRTGR